MPTNWIVPDSTSVQAILVAAVFNAANQAIGSIQSSDKLISMTVNRVRAAIQNGGVSSLSLTPGTIPPEGEPHVAALVIQALSGSNPALAQFVLSQPGQSKTGLALLIENAQTWLNRVGEDPDAKRLVVTPPSDPCGQDYLTAVSATNPAISAIGWGDQYGDMNDYAAGQVTEPDGSVVPLAPLDLNVHI